MPVPPPQDRIIRIQTPEDVVRVLASVLRRAGQSEKPHGQITDAYGRSQPTTAEGSGATADYVSLAERQIIDGGRDFLVMMQADNTAVLLGQEPTYPVRFKVETWTDGTSAIVFDDVVPPRGEVLHVCAERVRVSVRNEATLGSAFNPTARAWITPGLGQWTTWEDTQAIAAAGNVDIVLPRFSKSYRISPDADANITLQFRNANAVAVGGVVNALNAQGGRFPIPRQASQVRISNAGAAQQVPTFQVDIFE